MKWEIKYRIPSSKVSYAMLSTELESKEEIVPFAFNFSNMWSIALCTISKLKIIVNASAISTELVCEICCMPAKITSVFQPLHIITRPIDPSRRFEASVFILYIPCGEADQTGGTSCCPS